MIHKNIITYIPNDPRDGVTTHLRRESVFEDKLKNKTVLDELLSANNLTRNETLWKEMKGTNTINYSVARTQIDSMDKYTDYVQHCLWISVLGDSKSSNELISGLIHAPIIIIGANNTIQQQTFLKTLKQYQGILKATSRNYQVFYGGGAIRPKHPEYNNDADEDEDDEGQYIKGEKMLRYFVQAYLKTSPIKVTEPKGLGNELVHLKTQEQQILSYYPSFRG